MVSVFKSIKKEIGSTVKGVTGGATGAVKSVVGDTYKGAKTVAEDTGVAGAVRKGAKTFNKVGGNLVDNFTKITNALTSLITSPLTIGLIILLLVGGAMILRSRSNPS